MSDLKLKPEFGKLKRFIYEESEETKKYACFLLSLIFELDVDFSNDFKIRVVEESVLVSESTEGRYKRTKKTFVDLLTNIKKKYEIMELKV